MNGADINDAINKLIDSFMKRYQEMTRNKNEEKQQYI